MTYVKIQDEAWFIAQKAWQDGDKDYWPDELRYISWENDSGGTPSKHAVWVHAVDVDSIVDLEGDEYRHLDIKWCIRKYCTEEEYPELYL
jgi:hypothetical protein